MFTPANRFVRYVILNTATIIAMSAASTQAVQWQKLTRDGRHDIALDSDSVRQTTSGKLAVLLRYTPLGERQRRKVATEYNRKDYRLRLEYYEIDCGDSSAVLGQTDIIGSGGKRLVRLKGSSVPEAIIPGSPLDKAAHLVCPAQNESSTEDDTSPDAGDPPSTSAITVSTDYKSSPEAQNRIKDALRRIEAEAASHYAWVDLGNAYYDADMPRQAIDSYNHALALKPDNADVLNDQGAMYRQAGDTTKALKNFERALALSPNNLESLYNMGYIYAFDLNRIDQAMDIWRHYLELDHSSDTASQVQSFIERYGKKE